MDGLDSGEVAGVAHTTRPGRSGLDTRGAAGTYGGPSLAGQGSRSFPVAGVCGIPSTAKSLALNVTTVDATAANGNVRLYPTGLAYQPLGTANAYKAGYPRANQTFGSIDGPTPSSFTLFNDAPAGYPVNVIVDVQGYFAPGPDTPPQTGDSWFFTLRDSQNRPSTEYRWDSATPSTTLLKDHVYLGNLLVADYAWYGQPNGLVFYANDHLGTPRFMTEGTVPKWLATFKYRAFGLALTPQIPGQGIEFASMERDLASSDLYDHARYMGGKLSRFKSPDQLGGNVGDPQSWNRYSYARNNPLNVVDPDGRAGLGTVAYTLSQTVPLITSTLGITPQQLGSYAQLAAGSIGVAAAAIGGAQVGGAGLFVAATDAVHSSIAVGVGGAGVAAVSGASPVVGRAAQIHGVLDPIAQEMRTTAVLETTGGKIVAGGGRDLGPAQRALVGPGEVAAKLPGAHAEVTAIRQAQQLNVSPQSLQIYGRVDGTRPICPNCAETIRATGGTVTGPTTATWE